MRPGTIAIVGGISFVVIMTIVVLLFWFAAPRWQPELVMRYSPSLWHVIEAHGYYKNNYSFSGLGGGAMVTPMSGVSTVRRSYGASYSHDANGFVIYSEPTALNCYSRFVVAYGDEIFPRMAALDNNKNIQFTDAVIDFIGKHTHKPAARKILWQYSDAGNRVAKSILYHNHDRIPQGIDNATLQRAIQR